MTLWTRIRRSLNPAPMPAPDLLDLPVFAAMSRRELADLPLPRPVPPAEAHCPAPARAA
jgi:hypothetical protein